MRIGIFGTGSVGEALGTKLVALGHHVVMGSRTADHEKGRAWAQRMGSRAQLGTFEDAARHGELLFHCGSGTAALAILAAVPVELLRHKILVDVTNPLDLSRGFPPSLSTGGGTDSIAEAIQRTYPDLRVVKTLNTVTASVMAEPARAGEGHGLFLSGNDAAAKAEVQALLETFGWSQFVDLGDVTTARGAEAYVLLWIRLWGALKTPEFNIRITRAGS